MTRCYYCDQEAPEPKEPGAAAICEGCQQERQRKVREVTDGLLTEKPFPLGRREPTDEEAQATFDETIAAFEWDR